MTSRSKREKAEEALKQIMVATDLVKRSSLENELFESDELKSAMAFQLALSA